MKEYNPTLHEVITLIESKGDEYLRLHKRMAELDIEIGDLQIYRQLLINGKVTPGYVDAEE